MIFCNSTIRHYLMNTNFLKFKEIMAPRVVGKTAEKIHLNFWTLFYRALKLILRALLLNKFGLDCIPTNNTPKQYKNAYYLNSFVFWTFNWTCMYMERMDIYLITSKRYFCQVTMHFFGLYYEILYCFGVLFVEIQSNLNVLNSSFFNQFESATKRDPKFEVYLFCCFAHHWNASTQRVRFLRLRANWKRPNVQTILNLKILPSNYSKFAECERNSKISQIRTKFIIIIEKTFQID